MPATYTIDRERQLVMSRIWGPATEAEVLDHNQQLKTDPLFDPTFRQFADMTDVTEILVSTDTIEQTAHDTFFAPGVRRAFVAKEDACYGMARMYALYAESLGQLVHVFREAAEAEAWLGLRESGGISGDSKTAKV
ncbi:MAG: hypothetical protein ACREMS_00410 [Gemmatimonadaceae bacterium]